MWLLRKEIGSHKFFFAFLASLFSLLIFLTSSYLSPYFVFAIAPVIVLVHFTFREIKSTVFFSALFLCMNALIYLFAGVYLAVLHFGLLALGIYLVYGKNLKFTLAEILGINTKNILKNLAYALALFVGLIVFLIIANIILAPVGLADNKNVFEKIKTYPLYILPIAFLLAPLSEEIFFRGYLSKKYGILISSFIFAVAHIAYGSFVEILFAFIFGLAAGYLFRKTNSLAAPILTHFLFNLYFVFVFLLVMFLDLEAYV
ncbi:CPBP family intramembrane metalloprotease [Candidatus Micrarchaeota archaeon]|nr:CPBP family intramembrane metalloprotease [Candidatus Micrarchaeota archaeon]